MCPRRAGPDRPVHGGQPARQRGPHHRRLAAAGRVRGAQARHPRGRLGLRRGPGQGAHLAGPGRRDRRAARRRRDHGRPRRDPRPGRVVRGRNSWPVPGWRRVQPWLHWPAPAGAGSSPGSTGLPRLAPGPARLRRGRPRDRSAATAADAARSQARDRGPVQPAARRAARDGRHHHRRVGRHHRRLGDADGPRGPRVPADRGDPERRGLLPHRLAPRPAAPSAEPDAASLRGHRPGRASSRPAPTSSCPS